MKFARVVFIAGGVWGIAALAPFYWLVDITGRRYAAPIDYPQFFWGFFSVALAWQFAFLFIGSNPVRFRPLMVPAIVEKFGFIVTLVLLLGRGRIPSADAAAAIPDAVVGLLFVVALAATSSEARSTLRAGNGVDPRSALERYRGSVPIKSSLNAEVVGGSMPRFLIEVPHESDPVSCARANKVLLETGSHFLTHADFGCIDGLHKAWIIVEVDSKEEARHILPLAYRGQASIVQLNKFGLEELDEFITRHGG